jgi:glutathione S-transferase
MPNELVARDSRDSSRVMNYVRAHHAPIAERKMSFTLILGNKNYSSWSMRAWLLLRFVEAPFTEQLINLYTTRSRSEVRELGGQTGLVPVLRDGETTIWDTLAIVEYLYELYPQVWPKDRALRARARSICAEVHSSLNFMREAMPVNTRGRNRVANLTADVVRDVERVREIWDQCMTEHGGRWLLGEFCAADIFFAPIATRFQTYGVRVTGPGRAFYEIILEHPLVVDWLEAGINETAAIEPFELPMSTQG